MVAGGRELIDTLWNVNVDCSGRAGDKCDELIDTLWNVNTSAAEEPSGDAQGINRYIMECKYMSISEKFMQGEMN